MVASEVKDSLAFFQRAQTGEPPALEPKRARRVLGVLDGSTQDPLTLQLLGWMKGRGEEPGCWLIDAREGEPDEARGARRVLYERHADEDSRLDADARIEVEREYRQAQQAAQTAAARHLDDGRRAAPRYEVVQPADVGRRRWRIGDLRSLGLAAARSEARGA